MKTKLSVAVLFLLSVGIGAQQQNPKSDSIKKEKQIEEVVLIGYGTRKK